MNKILLSLVVVASVVVSARAAALEELAAQAGPSVVANMAPAPVARPSAGPIQPVLSCEDPGLHQSLQLFTYRGAAFEVYGQAILGPYRAVNVVCNNAIGLIGAKQPVKCVGAEFNGEVHVFDIVPASDGGYSWHGQRCR